MKAYILSEQDFERLLAALDRNPEYGYNGGSSAVLSEQERKAHKEAHGFYNHQIRRWIDSVKKDQ